MKISVLACVVVVCVAGSGFAASTLPLTDEWIAHVRELAPEAPSVRTSKTHRVLLFSLTTGFQHWVRPHTNAVIQVLADKSGICDVVQTEDIHQFVPDTLKDFDAVILNNNCSVGPRRDMFYDVLSKDKTITTEAQRLARAAQLEANLIAFVADGGGLMVLHGGIVMQNNSSAFSEMVGGSFDYHPPQQKVQLELVDPKHPLVAPFKGKPFIHVDEPYLFKNAYEKKNFRPLLSMDLSSLENVKKPVKEPIRYVSWIKRHGLGHVFYVSPSHNAQSFDARLLHFYLNGLQYVLGDFKCDDSPMVTQ